MFDGLSAAERAQREVHGRKRGLTAANQALAAAEVVAGGHGERQQFRDGFDGGHKADRDLAQPEHDARGEVGDLLVEDRGARLDKGAGPGLSNRRRVRSGCRPGAGGGVARKVTASPPASRSRRRVSSSRPAAPLAPTCWRTQAATICWARRRWTARRARATAEQAAVRRRLDRAGQTIVWAIA